MKAVFFIYFLSSLKYFTALYSSFGPHDNINDLRLLPSFNIDLSANQNFKVNLENSTVQYEQKTKKQKQNK